MQNLHIPEARCLGVVFPMCVPYKILVVLFNSQRSEKKAFPWYVVVTNVSQVFLIVTVCVWLIHVKEIEHQSLIIKDLLVKTECYNEPDVAAAAASKQPFSLAFLNWRELNLNLECFTFDELTF